MILSDMGKLHHACVLRLKFDTLPENPKPYSKVSCGMLQKLTYVMMKVVC